MQFTFEFINFFALGLKLALPLLVSLIMFIYFLGFVVGRRENWGHGDAIYWAFVTATTVGYGDYRPTRGGTRFLAILIAITGMIWTGIMVSIAVYSAEKAFTVEQGGVSMESVLQEMAQ